MIKIALKSINFIKITQKSIYLMLEMRNIISVLKV